MVLFRSDYPFCVNFDQPRTNCRCILKTTLSTEVCPPPLGNNVRAEYRTSQGYLGGRRPTTRRSRKGCGTARPITSEAIVAQPDCRDRKLPSPAVRNATFTTDLCDAIAAEYGTARLLALPVNDIEQGYDYPSRVRWSLNQDDLSSYQDAAAFLNFQQHRYGLPATRVWNFWRSRGSHVLELLRGLKDAVVTTLHTVLREPNPDQLMVMQQIAELSDRLNRNEPSFRRSSCRRSTKFQAARLTWFRMAFPICHFLTRISIKTVLEWKAKQSCSRSDCCRPTKALKT